MTTPIEKGRDAMSEQNETREQVAVKNLNAMEVLEVQTLTEKVQRGERLTASEYARLPKLKKMLERQAAKSASGKAPDGIHSPAPGIVEPQRVPMELTARLLGQTRKTLENWCLREGAPRNGDRTFDLPALFAWRIARAGTAARQLTPEAADEDKLYRRIKRMLAERKLWTTDLDLIFVDRAREIIVNVAHLVAAAFDAIERDLPKQVCELRTGEATEAEIRRRIANYFRDRRQSLADAPGELLIGMEADTCEPPQPSHKSSAGGSTSTRPSRSRRRGAKRSSRARGSRARSGSKGTSS